MGKEIPQASVAEKTVIDAYSSKFFIRRSISADKKAMAFVKMFTTSYNDLIGGTVEMQELRLCFLFGIRAASTLCRAIGATQPSFQWSL